MKRPANSRVRHGMPSCATYGCTRPACIEANRRDRNIRHQNLKNGGARVDAEEARNHALKLTRGGMSSSDIAARSGVSHTQIYKLLRGGLPRMLRVNSEAILGTPGPDEVTSFEREGWVDATGARRRLQALAVQGFPAVFLSEESDLRPRIIQDVRAGVRGKLRHSALRSIIALHEKFWDVDPQDTRVKPGEVRRSKDSARGENWWPTEAWSDIDDPDCKPTLKTFRYVILAENYRELVGEQHLGMKDAAERIGVSVDALDKAVRYYEMRMAQTEKE